jgi:hypothetical protein
MTYTPQQMRSTAEAYLAYHYTRDDRTLKGGEPQKTKIARERWYGAMRATESITGADRVGFVRGLDEAYTQHILNPRLRGFDAPKAVAEQLAANINEDLAGAFKGYLHTPAAVRNWAHVGVTA